MSQMSRFSATSAFCATVVLLFPNMAHAKGARTFQKSKSQGKVGSSALRQLQEVANHLEQAVVEAKQFNAAIDQLAYLKASAPKVDEQSSRTIPPPPPLPPSGSLQVGSSIPPPPPPPLPPGVAGSSSKTGSKTTPISLAEFFMKAQGKGITLRKTGGAGVGGTKSWDDNLIEVPRRVARSKAGRSLLELGKSTGNTEQVVAVKPLLRPFEDDFEWATPDEVNAVAAGVQYFARAVEGNLIEKVVGIEDEAKAKQGRPLDDKTVSSFRLTAKKIQLSRNEAVAVLPAVLAAMRDSGIEMTPENVALKLWEVYESILNALSAQLEMTGSPAMFLKSVERRMHSHSLDDRSLKELADYVLLSRSVPEDEHGWLNVFRETGQFTYEPPTPKPTPKKESGPTGITSGVIPPPPPLPPKGGVPRSGMDAARGQKNKTTVSKQTQHKMGKQGPKELWNSLALLRPDTIVAFKNGIFVEDEVPEALSADDLQAAVASLKMHQDEVKKEVEEEYKATQKDVRAGALNKVDNALDITLEILPEIIKKAKTISPEGVISGDVLADLLKAVYDGLEPAIPSKRITSGAQSDAFAQSFIMRRMANAVRSVVSPAGGGESETLSESGSFQSEEPQASKKRSSGESIRLRGQAQNRAAKLKELDHRLEKNPELKQEFDVLEKVLANSPPALEAAKEVFFDEWRRGVSPENLGVKIMAEAIAKAMDRVAKGTTRTGKESAMVITPEHFNELLKVWNSLRTQRVGGGLEFATRFGPQRFAEIMEDWTN